jgi:hypothetical protein
MPQICFKMTRKSLLNRQWKECMCCKTKGNPNEIALKKLARVFAQMHSR